LEDRRLLATNLFSPAVSPIIARHPELANPVVAVSTMLSWPPPNVAGRCVNLADAQGGNHGVLQITTEDASGNFQGTFWNSDLHINEGLAVRGTVGTEYFGVASGYYASIQFSGDGIMWSNFGSAPGMTPLQKRETQHVDYNGLLSINGSNISTSGGINATDEIDLVDTTNNNMVITVLAQGQDHGTIASAQSALVAC
jgi:hypothetical protein